MNRFELEQQIMQCWGTADDINLIYKRIVDGDLKGDDLHNVLLGLNTLHNLRCEELFELFERMIKLGEIR